MKKSSLLALSLVSLVALVGCGKKDAAKKVDAATFDEKASALFEKISAQYQEDPEFVPYKNVAILTYSWNQKATGAYVEESVPSGVYKGKVSFQIAYTADGWVYYPQEGDDYDEDDLAEIAEIIEDSNIGFLDTVYGYAGTGMYEMLEESYGASFYLNPFKIQTHNEQEGELQEHGISYVYEGGETFEFEGKLGQLVKYVDYSYEVDTGLDGNTELDGSLKSTETYTFKYLDEPLA